MKGRSASLDILRAVAVLLVIGYHGPRPLISEPWLTHVVAAPMRSGGWCGVDLFFVLSGFLVGGLLFREHVRHGRIAVGRFLVRRGLKIYPAFYAFLIATVAVRIAMGRTPSGTQILSEVFFLQSYVPGVWGHTWSLAVEEHFYLGLPLLLLLLHRFGRERRPFPGIGVVFAVAAAGCLALRMHVDARLPFTHATHYFPTHLRLDGLLCGVALAHAYHFHHDVFTRWTTRLRIPLAVAGAALLVPNFLDPVHDSPWMPTFGLTRTWLGSAALVCAAVAWEPRPTLPVRLFAGLGAASYSVYLWHLPARRLWRDLIEPRPPEHPYFLRLAAYAVTAIVMGIVAARVIESPVLRLRDRLFPSRSGPAVRETEPVA